jgi:hypothetical protein
MIKSACCGIGCGKTIALHISGIKAGNECTKTEDDERRRKNAKGCNEACSHAETCAKQIAVATTKGPHDKGCRQGACCKTKIEQADR